MVQNNKKPEHKPIKVKTKAKNIEKVLQAIIAQHLVEDTSDNNYGIGLFHADAAKYIMNNFIVTPRPGNEFGLATRAKFGDEVCDI